MNFELKYDSANIALTVVYSYFYINLIHVITKDTLWTPVKYLFFLSLTLKEAYFKQWFIQNKGKFPWPIVS